MTALPLEKTVVPEACGVLTWAREGTDRREAARRPKSRAFLLDSDVF